MGFDWVDGDDSVITRLSGDTALVEEQFAKTHQVGVGDTYAIEPLSGGTTRLEVLGVYRDPQLLQGTIGSQETFAGVSAARDPWIIFADARGGVDTAVAERRMEAALEGFPLAEVESRSACSDAIGDQLNQFVYLLYALLAMSVVISLFGIANSLFLAVAGAGRSGPRWLVLLRLAREPVRLRHP